MTLKRFMTMTAIAAAMAIPATGGFAQPATAQAPRHMATNEMRASKLIGSAVYDSSDQKLGSIADLIVDRDGKVTDVVVGVGDKNIGFKMADLKRGKDDHLVSSASKDALKQMAAYDLNHAAGERSGSSTLK